MAKENNVSLKIGLFEIGITSTDLSTQQLVGLVMSVIIHLLSDPKLSSSLGVAHSKRDLEEIR